MPILPSHAGIMPVTEKKKTDYYRLSIKFCFIQKKDLKKLKFDFVQN